MIICPNCQREWPNEAKFCMECGMVLAATAAGLEERKIITTMFCDIVSFTAMSEAADPEDVDALLGEYASRAREAIESHGGTVEKFIGDAVVGVFGVPVVHEDDPERAVRAGLRLVETLDDLVRPDGAPLQVRIGVNTGEALVRLDVDPLSGRGFLTGDAVNVAARLQAAAPPGGVVMGESTFNVAGRAFECEALAPVAAKGKSEPVAAWLAKAPLSRMGAVADRGHLTPLVGRQAELAYLRALFDKAVSTLSPQSVLIVGEPGIGKSRLVTELLTYVDAQSGMVTWRQGRCLLYGEGVSFSALAEIVKAHAGIFETDDAAMAETKLDAVVPDGPDHPWMANRLRALAGLEAPPAGRDENFAAWLRFIEHLALAGPLVLVLEDLHWADEGLLAFVEHVATHADAVPLVVIGTARPELFERHSTFAAGSSRLNHISLDPLTREETERLVNGLVGDAKVLGRRVADIAEQCEGNPFFAEESARLLTDQVQNAPVPASVQAVIAARLDALPPEHKAVLGDAAVVGGVFWNGAVAALAQREQEVVDTVLRDLVAKQLVRRVRESSMLGENEFAFAHVLARDVAYGQLPRAVRATKHATTAAWLEGKAGDRLGDSAEVLAHHYTTALDLAGAAGKVELAGSLAEPAMRYLCLSGDRAMALDLAAAERHYARALQLAGADGQQRPRLLVKWARVVTELGRRAEAIGAFEEAIARLRTEGDVRATAIAQIGLADALFDDDEANYLALADEAVALLEDDGPSPEFVTVLTEWLEITGGQGDSQRQLEVADRAVKLAKQLGLPLDARVVADRGRARCDLGDAGGMDDFGLALEMCRTSGTGAYGGGVFFWIGTWVYMFEGFRASIAILEEGLEVARRRGALRSELEYQMALTWAFQAAGEWDRVLDDAVAVEPLLESAAMVWALGIVRLIRTLVLVQRGRTAEAEEPAARVAERALVETGHTVAACCIAAAAARMAAGDSVAALELLADSEAPLRGKGGYWWADLLPLAVRTALAGGDRALAERLAESVKPQQPLSRHAIATCQVILAEAHQDREAAADGFADVALRWHDFGLPYEEAQALLGQGRCLVALGRAPEAAAPLAAAREIFARLGAQPALHETERVLSAARMEESS